jgi:hypothetical protein
MFPSKDGAYQRVGAWKHYTRLEVATRNKHSSLMGPNVSYEEKSFVITAPALIMGYSEGPNMGTFKQEILTEGECLVQLISLY